MSARENFRPSSVREVCDGRGVLLDGDLTHGVGRSGFVGPNEPRRTLISRSSGNIHGEEMKIGRKTIKRNYF